MERKLTLLGVDYTHHGLPDGSDLFLTEFGVPFREQLDPGNWFEDAWFAAHRTRLAGTSAVYRLPTRPASGKTLDLVVKWSRVGEEVPMDTMSIHRFLGAEFNSPFEEFAQVRDLRQGSYGPPHVRILTKHPLAIYVPSRKLQLWQTGRSEYRIQAKIARNPEVELDLLRQYVLIYQWIKGVDLIQAAEILGLGGLRREEFLAQHTTMAIHEMEAKGFRVLDMKPAHVIVRFNKQGRLLRHEDGQLAYAVVDYELLERTPDHEKEAQDAARRIYLRRIRGRFHAGAEIPPNLRRVRFRGVDYVVGRTESTGGMLFVVGDDPDLFSYFLPERWRRTVARQVFKDAQLNFTRSKDNVPLLWEVVDHRDLTQAARSTPAATSSFDLVATAIQQQNLGLPALSPRAIYAPRSDVLTDWFETHFDRASLAEADQVEPPVPSSIILWGFIEYLPDVQDTKAWKTGACIPLASAIEAGLLSEEASHAAITRHLDEQLAASLAAPPERAWLLLTGEQGQPLTNDTGRPLLLLLPSYRAHPVAAPNSGIEPPTRLISPGH